MFREALPQSLLEGFAWNMNEWMNVCGWYWRMPKSEQGRIVYPFGWTRKCWDEEVVKAIAVANARFEAFLERDFSPSDFDWWNQDEEVSDEEN